MSGWEAHVLDILQRLLQEPRGAMPARWTMSSRPTRFLRCCLSWTPRACKPVPTRSTPPCTAGIRAGGAGANRSGQSYFAHVRDSGHAFVFAILPVQCHRRLLPDDCRPHVRQAVRALPGFAVGDLNLNLLMASLLENRVLPEGNY